MVVCLDGFNTSLIETLLKPDTLLRDASRRKKRANKDAPVE